ncbi:MAG: hypothetical protein K2K24_00775 [Clostridia bacterium]|nr:hypothetical protein [Clostridia bacterium]
MITKDCFNCTHFLRYYIKDKYGNLLKIDKGHCINTAIRKRSDRTFERCGQWQLREPDAVQRNVTIKYILKRMEYLLENLSIAIKDDDDLDYYKE